MAGAVHEAAIADSAAREGAAAQSASGQSETCANCSAPLDGAYCTRCGQRDDDLRRPIWSLIGELVEGLFALDGRVARTLPGLMLRPGHVTRAYIDGARARYVQPFRLFLFASLIFFFVFTIPTDPSLFQLNQPTAADLEATVSRLEETRDRVNDELQRAGEMEIGPAAQRTLDASIAATRRELEAARQREAEREAERLAQGGDAATDGEALETAAEREASRVRWKCGIVAELTPEDPPTPACADAVAARVLSGDGAPRQQIDASGLAAFPIGMRRLVATNLGVAIDRPNEYLAALNRWAPRLVALLFPIYAILLGVLHFWRRDRLIYDHIITSLHLHVFLFVFLVALRTLDALIPGPILALAFLLGSNVYLYRLLRRVYDDSRIGSLARVVVLDLSYLLVLVVAGLGLAALGVVFI